MDDLQKLLDQGRALALQGQRDAAIAAFRAAILAAPGHPAGYVGLADLLFANGFDVEARGICDIGISRTPVSPRLHWLRCMAMLPAVYADQADLEASRSRFVEALHGLRAISFASPSAIADAAATVGLKAPFFLPYQGRNDRDLFALHGRLASDVMAAALPDLAAPTVAAPRPGERLRIGIVSGLFWRHSVWRLPVRGWVEHLDRSRFELFGYHTRTESDDQTARAERSFDRFVQGTRPLTDWIRLIQQDAPHVLIYPETAMDHHPFQLAALRLAPVQCTSWGQPVTSGLPTIDHYLSSDAMEPPEAAGHYTEDLVRLPGLGTVYDAESSAWGDEVPAGDTWAPLDAPPGTTRFFCCQSSQKYLPAHDDIYPRIAAALPGARFVFLNAWPRATETLWRRLDAAFARHGLVGATYCRFANAMPHAVFAALLRDSHVFLDTPDWSGCNTVLEALRYRVPIVTFPGEMMRARHAAAILGQAGVTETIAGSIDEYVDFAVRLGRDADWRDSVAARMQAGADRVFGDLAPVRGLEDFLTEAVARAFAA